MGLNPGLPAGSRGSSPGPSPSQRRRPHHQLQNLQLRSPSHGHSSQNHSQNQSSVSPYEFVVSSLSYFLTEASEGEARLSKYLRRWLVCVFAFYFDSFIWLLCFMYLFVCVLRLAVCCAEPFKCALVLHEFEVSPFLQGRNE